MKARGRRSGFTLIELLVVVVIIGLLAAISMNNFSAAQDKARISSLRSNIKNISVALEQYSADNNGSYPATGQEVVAGAGGLLQNGYLGGNQWPHAPWGNLTQTNHVVPGAPMETAANLAAGTVALPSVNVGKPMVQAPIGKLPPAAGSFALDVYGTIVYDFDQPTTTWVLYGVGKDHKVATLSAAKSNGGGN
ncbi:MAG: N-terminal methylation motif protein [Cyanobacteria bacterium RYN_339]|nr:N-terminal methylation motif protein [Cyanobacteria bacterium RYN_339]